MKVLKLKILLALIVLFTMIMIFMLGCGMHPAQTPVTGKPVTKYYRLVQVDKDSTRTTVSDIKKVTIKN